MRLTLQAPGPMPKLWIGLRVEKNGIILSERYEEAHSWTRNAWMAMNALLLDFEGNDSIDEFDRFAVTTAGAFQSGVMSCARRTTFAGSGLYNNAASATFGIVAGSGDAPYSPYHYQVDGLIAHGNGAGQLFYQAQEAPVTTRMNGGSPIEKKITQTVTRVFNNNSGDSITVRNLGLIWRGGMFATNISTNYLFAFDVLATPEVVADGAQLTAWYDIETEAYPFEEHYPLPIGEQAFGGTVMADFLGQTLIIVAPKLGGEHTSKNYKTPAATSGPEDMYDGSANTADLLANYTSGIAQFADGVNNSSPPLGGHTDWCVPARYQLQAMYTQRSFLPEGEGFETQNYWSSTRTGSAAYTRNLGTGAESSTMSQTSNYHVRLIRQMSFQDYWASL